MTILFGVLPYTAAVLGLFALAVHVARIELPDLRWHSPRKRRQVVVLLALFYCLVLALGYGAVLLWRLVLRCG